MQCFRVIEGIERGLPVPRGCIEEPEGCSMRLCFRDELLNAIDSTSVQLKLTRTQIEFADDCLIFGPPKKGSDRQALVRIETPGGVGGKARLMACSYDHEIRGGSSPRVIVRNHPFPSAGVIAFATKARIAQLNKGVPYLDVLVLMHQGASFRVQRSGQLEGCSPWIDVRWNGFELTLRGKRAYERAEGAGFGDAAVEEAAG